ncbi:uncharacterized protein LAJ45_05131 [Morchella importuna]|uniref:uncharacterized protein n=1 Tax=Morchella importuna TaxID=1174673 RepID=UPI001E8E8D7E|nr:uncharacterized protein LAJ45_05131 [Morchella importuna]KAH8150948.1 hypothetical protein LAJ45_05131 [Morchella importuna]
MPIQTHPRLEPKTIPRAQPRKLYPPPALSGVQQRLRDRLRVARRDRDLEPVLARVPAARDMQLLHVVRAQRDSDGSRIPKVQRAEVELPACGGGVEVFLEDILCERALQGDEALVVQDGVAHGGAGAAVGGVEVREVVGEVCCVFGLAGGVGNDVEGGGVLEGDDEVVDDAAGDGVQED